MNYHLHFVKLLMTRREGIGSTVLCYLLLLDLETLVLQYKVKNLWSVGSLQH